MRSLVPAAPHGFSGPPRAVSFSGHWRAPSPALRRSMGCAQRSYPPRHAEASVLYRFIPEHLDDLLRAAADRAAGAGLPEFIAREFREFLTCGVPAHGFARVRCQRCALDLDVLRCPRCAGRMQLIATIEDPAVVQRILTHLRLPGAREDPRPLLPLTAAGAEQPALPGVIV